MKLEDVIEMLSEIHSGIDYRVETALIDDEIFDSMDLVVLISEILERFEIRVPANEIIPTNFNSATSIYELLKKL